MSSDPMVARDQLKSVVERIERLEEEKKRSLMISAMFMQKQKQTGLIPRFFARLFRYARKILPNARKKKLCEIYILLRLECYRSLKHKAKMPLQTKFWRSI